jgi:GNAT superfamily N-acetyltransferase
VTPIRPLAREDLPQIAAIYGEFVEYAPASLPGLVAFFERLLFADPFADPEIPAWVYEDPDAGVIGLRCVHARRFLFEERPVRVASAGPMVVHPGHRRKGIATQLVARYFEGPQEISAGDRAIDAVHSVWERLGTVTWTAASLGWGFTLTPVGRAAATLGRRTARRDLPPGARPLSRLDALAGRRRAPAPESGTIEVLANRDLVGLLRRLDGQFPLRPDYDEAYLEWLFGTMELVNLGKLVRRLVRDDDGEPLGAYVMYVNPHWRAYVMQVAATQENAGLVLDHLLHDAAGHGAVEVQGRFEPHLIPHLRRRRCRLIHPDWAHVKTDDPVLRSAVLAGDALLSRLDGEWWMRPADVRTAEAIRLAESAAPG